MKTNTDCLACGTTFLCDVNHIEKCHCSSLALSKKALEFIKEKYDDCLCPTCLQTISASVDKNTRQRIK